MIYYLLQCLIRLGGGQAPDQPGLQQWPAGGADRRPGVCVQRGRAGHPAPRPQEALLLAATRRLQPPVTGLHLAPSLLVTVGGDTITTFNFWTEGCSSVSEFFM